MTQLTVNGHNWVSLTYGDFNSYLVITRLIHNKRLDVSDHDITQTIQFEKTNNFANSCINRKFSSKP